MNRVNSINCLQLDNDCVVYEQVDSVADVDPNTVIGNRKSDLRRDADATLAKLMDQTSLVR